MLIHSEKMASIGQLAAGVAHEINNPTGYIISNLSSLGDYAIAIEKFLTEFQKIIAEENATAPLAQCKDTEHYRRLADIWAHEHIDFIVDDICDLVEQTQEGATRIVKIVSNLNSFARIDDDEATATDINDCLDRTLSVARNELKYKCEVVKDYSVLPELKCNPGQLSQVFMNILVNAAQSIADKGTIVVTTECDGAEIRVKIADDGAGMHPEILTKIFDPFFTTKKVGAGTGLGLSVSHGIVEKHGGDIHVESEIDHGSCFTVHLPIGGLKDSASDHEHKQV